MRRKVITTVKERRRHKSFRVRISSIYACMCVAVSVALVGLSMRSPTQIVHAASITYSASLIREGVSHRVIPVYDELATVPRSELADLRSAEEWEEPWTLPISQYELDLLAALVWAECGDQPLPDGLCFGCDCVLNRVDDPRWPSTIEGVIYQSGQFEVVRNGALDRAYGNAPQIAYDAVISQLQNRWNYQIQFFSMGYNANGTLAFVHGTHYYSY